MATIERLALLAGEESRSAVRLALRTAMNDADPDVAAAALAALGVAGGFEDIGAVIDAVASGRAAVLGSAMTALSALAARWPEQAAVAALSARRDERAALPVAIVIGTLGGGVLGDAVDDVAFLSAAMSSADPETRKAAVDAIAKIGLESGLDAVELAVADEVRDVQLSAVRALGRLRTGEGRRPGVDRLIDLTGGNDAEIAAAAARALGEATDPRACASLVALVGSASPIVAVAAVEALGRIRDRASIEALISVGEDVHVEVTKAVLLALDRIADSRAFARVGRALDHDAWDVRRVAADCLGRFGGHAAADLLRARLAIEKEPIVAEAIVEAIASLEAPPSVRCRPSIAPGRADT